MEGIRSLIDTYIKKNGNQDITGDVLNNVLHTLVDDIESYVIKSLKDVKPGTPGEGTIVLDDFMSDISENGVMNRVIKAYVDDVRNDMPNFWREEGGKVVTDKPVTIYDNLVVEGDVASSAPGENNPVGIQGIKLNGQTYTDYDGDGVIDLGEIESGLDTTELLSWLDTNKYINADNLDTYGVATQSWVNEQGFAKTTDIPTLKSLMGGSAIGGTTSYIYWNGSAWATKALGDRAFDSTAYQPLATAINTGNIGSYAPLYDADKNVTIQGNFMANLLKPTNYLWMGDLQESYYLAKNGIFWHNSANAYVTSVILFSQSNITLDLPTTVSTNLYVAGNVGIGVDNPQYKLDVTGDSRINGALRVQRYYDTYSYLDIVVSDVSVSYNAYDNSDGWCNQYFRCQDKTIMTLAADGANINGNLIVAGDVASGGAGQETNAYLPLSGGTITAPNKEEPLTLDSAMAQVRLLIQQMGLSKSTLGWHSSFGTWMYDHTTGCSLGIRDTNGTPFYYDTAFREIIHSGNIGSYAPIYDSDKNVTIQNYLIANTLKPVNYLWMGDLQESYYLAKNGIFWHNSANAYVTSVILFSQSNITLDLPTTVSSNLYVAGTVTQGSDIRFKHRMNDVNLDLDVMANAPLFSFYWNDRNDNQLHIGTSAQYWEIYRNELVSGTDFKGLDYSTLGVAMGISLAKKSINHEQRLEVLEDKIKYMEERYGVCE